MKSQMTVWGQSFKAWGFRHEATNWWVVPLSFGRFRPLSIIWVIPCLSFLCLCIRTFCSYLNIYSTVSTYYYYKPMYFLRSYFILIKMIGVITVKYLLNILSISNCFGKFWRHLFCRACRPYIKCGAKLRRSLDTYIFRKTGSGVVARKRKQNYSCNLLLAWFIVFNLDG